MAFTAVQSDAVAPTRPSKAALFRAELVSPELSFAMEAHNGLSAKVVEEAGFRVIWASGLSISAALGVRDNNEASWTQVLETLEFMADRDDRADPGRWRHRLRQFQQHASPGAQAVPARHRRRLYRGQAVPEDELVHRRGPAAGRHRGVLRQDQGRQGQPDRSRLVPSSPASRR